MRQKCVITAVERQIVDLLSGRHRAHRSVLSLKLRGDRRYFDGFRDGTSHQLEVGAGLLLHIDRSAGGCLFETWGFDGEFVRSDLERTKGESSVLGGHRRKGQAGSIVREHNGSVSDDRPRRIGNRASDRAGVHLCYGED